MFKYYPYLADASFLQEVDNLKCTTYYARITVLDKDDNPIESIEGYVTGGSLNKSGSAAVRVNGSLTVVADDFTYQIENIDNIISINKKVDIEVGIANTLNKYTNYSVIWFPQGVMGITQASIQHNMSNYNISLSFKDKMAFLNGELGGTLPAPIDFSPLVVYDDVNNTRSQAPTPIDKLIYTLVNELGGVPKNKIFINDIQEYLLNICSWSANANGALRVRDSTSKPLKLDYATEIGTAPSGCINEIINYGDILGYAPQQFVYPGNLSCNAGDVITSVLDKVKNTLGNFEYFFDINGNFIFQKIRNFLNAGNAEEDLTRVLSNDYIMAGSDSYRSVYEFTDLSLVVSINNQPQYAKIKNDFNVWGKRNNLPIRYHLVLDDMPVVPDKTFSVKIVKDKDDTGEAIIHARYPGHYYCVPSGAITSTGATVIGPTGISTSGMDWRTYQYLDYVCNRGATGYEKSPYAEELYANWPLLKKLETLTSTGSCVYVDKVWNNAYFLDVIDVANPAISQFNVKNIGRRTVTLKEDSINCLARPSMGLEGSYTAPIIYPASTDKTAYWRDKFKPTGANPTGAILQVKDSIYTTSINPRLTAYSAFEHLRGELYNYITYNETISLTVIPILHLEPNMRITIRDPATSVNGDYVINTLSIPLSANGTMNISAKKALERI